MYCAPRIEPVSNLVRDSNGFLAGLNGGPVHLTQHGREVAVILTAAEWRKLVEHIENLEAVVQMYNAEQNNLMERMSPEELDALIGRFIAEGVVREGIEAFSKMDPQPGQATPNPLLPSCSGKFRPD
jgi:PHD/YefM family antitoxin component YafN of YafNO toxin-antitoxin module